MSDVRVSKAILSFGFRFRGTFGYSAFCLFISFVLLFESGFCTVGSGFGQGLILNFALVDFVLPRG